MSTSWDLLNPTICSFFRCINILTNATITLPYPHLFLSALKLSLRMKQSHKEGGQKHTETGSGTSHISALNLERLLQNPTKHTCTYGKVMLEHANEAWLCSTKLKGSSAYPNVLHCCCAILTTSLLTDHTLPPRKRFAPAQSVGLHYSISPLLSHLLSSHSSLEIQEFSYNLDGYQEALSYSSFLPSLH